MAYHCVFCQVWIPPVKEDDTTKDASFGPIPDTIGYALGVLIIVAIPGVAKESSWKGSRVEPLVFLRRPPRAKGVILMPARVLRVEPGGDVVNGSGHELDKPGQEAGGSGRGRLVLTKRLGARKTISKALEGLLSELASYLRWHEQSAGVETRTQFLCLLGYAGTQFLVFVEEGMPIAEGSAKKIPGDMGQGEPIDNLAVCLSGDGTRQHVGDGADHDIAMRGLESVNPFHCAVGLGRGKKSEFVSGVDNGIKCWRGMRSGGT